MTQPSFVPIAEADQVRPARRLHVPGAWSPQRPGEIHVPVRSPAPGMGTPGPDQGFALHLAHRFAGRLHLEEGESAEDAMVGCALLGARRAAIYGRAPSTYDLTAAFSIWGFLGDAPSALVALRRGAFLSVSHDYDIQRGLVDRVPEASLALTPTEVAERVAAGEWRVLLDATEAGQPA